LLEGHTVAAPVFCGLRVIPFEHVIVHLGTGYQYYIQGFSPPLAALAERLERRHASL
jgi:hypothetical protein